MFLKIDLKKPSNKNAEVATSAFCFILNNFLREQGLGGPCDLAVAKASRWLAPSVRK